MKLLHNKFPKLNILSILATWNEMFNVMGINILYIIIPVAVERSLLILKKKNMLDGIIEKLNFVENFSKIKEKLYKIREK